MAVPPDHFTPYAPDGAAVLRLDEARPPDHPVQGCVDLVPAILLDRFAIPPGPKGEKPYRPHALVGILAWGYRHGVRASRKLARLARQEAAFSYLAGGAAPNYRPLARFRRDNAAACTAVFPQTVRLALRLGVTRLGHGALDGPKRRATTAQHTALSEGGMQRRERELKEEIARLVARADAQDAAEDQASGAASAG